MLFKTSKLKLIVGCFTPVKSKKKSDANKLGLLSRKVILKVKMGLLLFEFCNH